jgi:hypothetical protein
MAPIHELTMGGKWWSEYYITHRLPHEKGGYTKKEWPACSPTGLRDTTELSVQRFQPELILY